MQKTFRKWIFGNTSSPCDFVAEKKKNLIYKLLKVEKGYYNVLKDFPNSKIYQTQNYYLLTE